MKKLFLSLSLCLAALTSALAATWTDDNGVTWTYSLINSNTEVRITGVSNYPAELTVPATIDGKTVTQFGDPGITRDDLYAGVFEGKNDIISITLPSSMTTIGVDAFRASSLKSIDLGHCTYISGHVFRDCKQLETVGDVSSITFIGNAAFHSSSIAEIGDLSSLTQFDVYVFGYCTNLIKIGFPSHCKLIPDNLFCGCTKLASVGDLSSCTSIGVSAFYGCISLESLNLSSCTSIGVRAFYGCTSLASVDLSSCQSIGDNAFYGCTNLASVGNLSSCTSIGGSAFNNCTSLASVGDLSSCTSIGGSAFNNCTSLASVGDLSSCQSIGDNAFSGCTNLASVGDLSSCTSIGFYAFNGCASLTSVNVSSTVPPVLSNVNAFLECTTVIVPAANLADYKTAEVWKDMSARIIADNVQTTYNVTGLRALDQGSTLQDAIGEDNLANVINLKMSGNINGYDIMVMRNKMHNLHKIDMTDVNIVANDYCYYEGNHTDDNMINPYTFYNQKKLISINLPETITAIKESAFSKCSALSNVNFGNKLKTIEQNAFYQCTSLRSVVLPEGLERLSEGKVYSFNSTLFGAFYECGLQEVSLPNSLKIIGGNCFAKNNLNNVTLPSDLEEIQNYAFFGNSRLERLEIPSKVKIIGENAFKSCSSLSSVIFPASIIAIGDNAFSSSPIREVRSKLVDPFTIAQSSFDASTWTNATLYVPMTDEWKATYNKYYWDTQWSQFANIEGWDPTIDNFYIDNDYQLNGGQIGHGQDNGDGTTSNSPNADLNNGSGFIVSDDGEQNFDDVHIKGDGTSSGSIIGENIHANKLHIDINVVKNKWYFFAFPFNVALANVEAPGNFVFREYDGKERADNGRGGWKNLPKSQEYLYAGKGYIFQTNKDGVLTLPVEHPDFSALQENLALDTHSAANAQDASWNFVGNPFLSYYDIDAMDFDAPITIWNGSGYEAVRPGDDDYRLYPYQAFFVQKPSAAELAQIGFNLVEQETKNGKKSSAADEPSPVAARRLAMAASNRKLVNLTVSDGTYTDKTRVVFNDKCSMNYESECDAAKFMSSEDVPQLYTTYANVSYQINERPTGSGEVQLGFAANKEGSYVISATRMDTPMLLKDMLTGVTFDFADGEYAFESKAGTFNERFLLISKSNAPTGIDAIEGCEEGKAKIYDLNGRRQPKMQQGVQVVDGKKLVTM